MENLAAMAPALRRSGRLPGQAHDGSGESDPASFKVVGFGEHANHDQSKARDVPERRPLGLWVIGLSKEVH
jgi:hypothetical protein